MYVLRSNITNTTFTRLLGVVSGHGCPNNSYFPWASSTWDWGLISKYYFTMLDNIPPRPVTFRYPFKLLHRCNTSSLIMPDDIRGGGWQYHDFYQYLTLRSLKHTTVVHCYLVTSVLVWKRGQQPFVRHVITATVADTRQKHLTSAIEKDELLKNGYCMDKKPKED